MTTLTLLELQQQFAACLPSLIAKAHSLGYHVTLGDAYRDPRAFGDLERSRPTACRPRTSSAWPLT